VEARVGIELVYQLIDAIDISSNVVAAVPGLAPGQIPSFRWNNMDLTPSSTGERLCIDLGDEQRRTQRLA
jgi:hypothetical protein